MKKKSENNFTYSGGCRQKRLKQRGTKDTGITHVCGDVCERGENMQ